MKTQKGMTATDLLWIIPVSIGAIMVLWTLGQVVSKQRSEAKQRAIEQQAEARRIAEERRAEEKRIALERQAQELAQRGRGEEKERFFKALKDFHNIVEGYLAMKLKSSSQKIKNYTILK